MIGKIIKTLRLKRMMTQNDLEKACELSKGYIPKLEDNRIKSPTLDTTIKLADVLEISLDDLKDLLVDK